MSKANCVTAVVTLIGLTTVQITTAHAGVISGVNNALVKQGSQEVVLVGKKSRKAKRRANSGIKTMYQNPKRKMGVFAGQQGTAADKDCDNTTFCGCGDVFVMYEEDANGNKIPGTEEYGCTE